MWSAEAGNGLEARVGVGKTGKAGGGGRGGEESSHRLSGHPQLVTQAQRSQIPHPIPGWGLGEGR